MLSLDTHPEIDWSVLHGQFETCMLLSILLQHQSLYQDLCLYLPQDR